MKGQRQCKIIGTFLDRCERKLRRVKVLVIQLEKIAAGIVSGDRNNVNPRAVRRMRRLDQFVHELSTEVAILLNGLDVHDNLMTRRELRRFQALTELDNDHMKQWKDVGEVLGAFCGGGHQPQ